MAAKAERPLLFWPHVVLMHGIGHSTFYFTEEKWKYDKKGIFFI